MIELIKGKKYYCSDYLHKAEEYRKNKEKYFLYEFDGEKLYCKGSDSHSPPDFWKYKVPEDCSEETQRANARLIAAAPDLLRALEMMLKDYRTECCPDPECSVCSKSRVAENTVRAAIAKAKGEEKKP